MRLSLCTITFRHHLISLDEIAAFARTNGFDGVELWGVHARSLEHRTDRDGDWLAGLGLNVPMLSDYLPLEADPVELRRRMFALIRLARRWQARKIRTFAGSKGSAATSEDERRLIATRLRELSALADDHGLSLLAETHPNTLADCGASTLRLIEEVGHDAFGINFDTLHVWEGGDDPVAFHRTVRPHVRHYHFKNIRARNDLAVFEPANVYSPAGRRDGMTRLFEGTVDYQPFLGEISGDDTVEASLEWFGADCMEVLRHDRRVLAETVAPGLRLRAS
ncbi:sugar phosphate isomerase/epimerase family protein [Shinella sp.]|uniref:sugar phosphate isomerase/epimerase family protein n=1 Tax=Shinella sp. TaxID=1870904 RepID=UPI003F6FC10A